MKCRLVPVRRVRLILVSNDPNQVVAPPRLRRPARFCSARLVRDLGNQYTAKPGMEHSGSEPGLVVGPRRRHHGAVTILATGNRLGGRGRCLGLNRRSPKAAGSV